MLIGAPILSAQSKKEYNPEVIEKIVASGDYKINVGTYMPPSGEYIELDYPENSIEIKNDSVFSDLFFVDKGHLQQIGYERRSESRTPRVSDHVISLSVNYRFTFGKKKHKFDNSVIEDTNQSTISRD